VLHDLPFVVRLSGVVHDIGAAAPLSAGSFTTGSDELWLVMQFVEVHALGVAHLDLKLDNIMLTRDGEICVIDFGMSLLTSHPGGAALPTNAAVGGTHGFMPPEQVGF
jgi:serine/threonine protein kinase